MYHIANPVTVWPLSLNRNMLTSYYTGEVTRAVSSPLA